MSGKKPLTAAAVRKFAPAARRRRIPDAGMRSLFLIVEPSGHKSWQMRFRVGSGRIGKMTLGPVDLSDNEMREEPALGQPLTLAAARQLAARVHRERALGHDPIADHKAARERQRAAVAEAASNTFAAAAQEFIERYARPHVRRWKEIARLLGFEPAENRLEVIPGGLAQRWADKVITTIDGHDIFAVVKETRERGAPGLERRSEEPTESRARAMLSALSGMFRWLWQERRVDGNPCAGVHRPEPPEARDRVLSNAEIVAFWKATDAVAAPFAAVLKLLLLTGQRLNEIAGLRWDELNGGAALNIPGARSKNGKPHVVPLAPLAREIIEHVPRREGAPLLFTSTGSTPISGWSKCKERIDAAMTKALRKQNRDATLPPWRLHDLRRTFVTGVCELGIAPHVVEAAVNHISGHRGGVAGVYNRSTLLPERKMALERWATHVHGLVSAGPDNVVAMRKQRGQPRGNG
jgi:integrase